MRIGRDEWGLRLASATALRSTCLRRHVGCVLTDAWGRVLATGYNGVARGVAHCNDAVTDGRTVTTYPNACAGAGMASGTGLDLCEATHAEANALLQCRDPDQIETCYVTTAPCITCVKLLVNTGCRRVVFEDEYAVSGERLWLSSEGRTWVRV